MLNVAELIFRLNFSFGLSLLLSRVFLHLWKVDLYSNRGNEVGNKPSVQSDFAEVLDKRCQIK